MLYSCILFFCFFLTPAFSDEPEPVKCITQFKNQTAINCKNVGSDGRPLDEVLRQWHHQWIGRNFTFDELASSIKIIEVSWAEGNVTITKNGLADLPNLEYLTLESSGILKPKYLIISPQEFVNTPKLTSLWIHGFTLTSGSIQALSTLKDRVASLTLRYSEPQKELLQEVAKFTNLTYKADFSGMCSHEPFPVEILKKSATTLRAISILNCNLPKITKRLLSGMPNLWYLLWQMSNITEIEAGAFDEVPNLTNLDLEYNNIQNLPDGLFNKTTKLRKVEFGKSGIKNLSPDNFTHCEDFERLRLWIS